MRQPMPPEEILPAKTEEIIPIASLEKEYQPSEFPHLEMIKKLSDISNASRLAKRFHTTDTTLCAGCHHNGPLEPKGHPAACKNCHTITSALNDLSKPRLLAAYHLQCVGCHKRMNLEEQGCTDCHKEKKSAGQTVVENIGGGEATVGNK